MMLPSNFIRVFLTSIMFCFISACTNLKPVTSAANQPENNQVQADNDSLAQKEPSTVEEPSIQPAIILPVVPDPMAGDIPLGLIRDYDQVKGLMIANKNEQAISLLEQIQLKYPQQSGPSYRIARVYLQQKKYAEALESVEKCLTINPKNYYALNLKGIVLREQGQFAQAKAAYLSALQIYPRHPQSHLNLAILADIYLYELPLALEHYEYYLALSQIDAQKVNGWIIDLKRRLPE